MWSANREPSGLHWFAVLSNQPGGGGLPADNHVSSVHLVHQGRYVKAGDELPPIRAPPHLAFAIDPPQTSGPSSFFFQGHRGISGGDPAAKSAATMKKGKL
jgi:hypothetical protein